MSNLNATNKKNVAYSSYFIRVFETDKTNNVVIDIDKITQSIKLLQADKFAIIKHSKDIEDDGQLKAPHYHIWLKYDNKRGFDDVLTKFEESLGISHDIVSFEVCKNDKLAVQYLIHKNDSSKYQYERREIVSNLTSNELVSLLIPFEELPIEEQIKFTPATLLQTYGLSTFKGWGNTLKQALEVLHVDTIEKVQYENIKSILKETLFELEKCNTLEDFLELKKHLLADVKYNI